MHTFKLEVEDSVIDKVRMLLKQLPQNKVRIKEDTIENQENSDFIAYLTSNPVKISDNNNFLSQEDSNAR